MEIGKIKQISSIDKNKTKDYEYETFHQAIGPILFVSKFMALMPLVKVMNCNPNKVRFHLKSFGVIYTFTFLAAGLFVTLLLIKKIFADGITTKNIVSIVFFSCGLTACSLFLSLAKKWPNIITYWTNIEIIFLKEPYKMPKRSLSKRIRVAGIIIAILAAVEHGLYWSSTIYDFKMKSDLCNNTKPVTYENLMFETYPYIFTIIPFSIQITTPILMLIVIFTSIWNFLDFFIMMISIGISTRFEQINDRIDRLSGKDISEDIWANIRNDYIKLLELLEYVDEKMAPIILLSCANNLYFICVQLLNIFNPLRWLMNYIYFWYSLLYLIVRTTFIFLCASAINDESKVPLKSLQQVSSEGWNSEVERFISEITNNCVALSGMKFFYLTRKLLFGMAGTIVTYELVLLQVDEENRSKGLAPLCD